MTIKATWNRDKLKKKMKLGFRGFPVATLAYYGPDDQRASKVSVGIILQEGGEPVALERWFNQSNDIRFDTEVIEEIARFLKQHAAKSVVAFDRIIGCPHEEETDYPTGEKCPHCPFWAAKDRFTGETLQ